MSNIEISRCLLVLIRHQLTVRLGGLQACWQGGQINDQILHVQSLISQIDDLLK